MNTAAKETFGDIIKGNTPVLVDFFAEWCGPCKTMKPILEELRGLMGDKVRILKIKIDKNPAITRSLNIAGVPTLVLYQKGQMLWRQSGVVPAKQLQSIISSKAVWL
jgi:thioredoxin 1